MASFETGARVGSFEILSPLGKGGMGEVYRARDTRLKRDVAIKVLPDGFSRDAERLARFRREAEILASLNHPGIATIHELGESGETRFLVMELVEGETLAGRIQRGPMPIADALNVARQIAESLEAAHTRGIVHRDLKPANIKFTPEGKVKVLDFGIAKIHQTVGMDPSDTPTLSITEERSVLGTPAYMSPEQAAGADTDRQTDVWAFGCVLYEMLTAQRAFDGATTWETLGSVLRSTPKWDRLPAETPDSIRRLLRRCLQRDRSARIRDIGDIGIEISEALSPEVENAKATQPVGNARAFVFAGAALGLLVAGAAAGWFLHAPLEKEARVEIATPSTLLPDAFAISPDGNTIAFIADADGRPQLWLRPMNGKPSVIPGSDFALVPFWSPDSRFVAFTKDDKLMIADVLGGAPRFLVASGPFSGGAWSGDTILFTTAEGMISSVPANGGALTRVTHLVGKQSGHFFPAFLPDGKHFLYFVMARDEASGVYLDELGKSSPRRLMDADSGAVYVLGHLLFARQGTLFAQAFDTGDLALRGNPFPIGEDLTRGGGGPAVAGISASVNGTIVFRKTVGNPMRQLTWFDRKGMELEKVGPPTDISTGSLSTDGRRVAFSRVSDGNYDVFLLDVERGRTDRFTSDAATDAMPVISPDHDHVAFTSNRQGAWSIYRGSINTPGAEQALLADGKVNAATDWARDGRSILYRTGLPGKWDIWLLPLNDAGKPGLPRPILQTDADERDAVFSPDGKWIVYQSNKSGHFEIYIQPFPGPGPALQISEGGGTQAHWRGDSKEVFYIGGDGKLFAAPLKMSPAGEVRIEPVALFNARLGFVDAVNRQFYVPWPDGQKFLIATALERPIPPLTVVLNWSPTKSKQ